MDLAKLSFYSRKIHRISLLFVVVLGLVQMTTGLTMKYPKLFPFIDPGAALSLHFQNATYFTVAFSVQMITGIIMYITPWLVKQFNKPPTPPTKLPN